VAKTVQRPVMINFINFCKAFDCIHRPLLWAIFPDMTIAIIENLYKKLEVIIGD